ncbi:MAG TPA: DinB family protein [Chryseosolibacter sp.]|nr:DinB family protein [Chryseosolibacter sp.]
MRTHNNTLIDELLALTDACTTSALKFQNLPLKTLNFKETPDKWSVLECLEHLNRYGDYYLPEIEKAINDRKTLRTKNGVYQSGMIGNYFANLMKVKNGKMVRMKTPSDKNPSGSDLSPITIDRFIKQQEMLRSLLEQSRRVDLTKTKVPISIAKFIKLRLGDTFRFLIYHIERHVIQAQNAAKKGQAETVSQD